MCVYTDDYLDKDEVEDVRKRIRALLPDLRLLYKPDIYTVLVCGPVPLRFMLP